VGLFSLPSPEYRLFISHAWDYKSEYDGVVNLLNADTSFKWINLSVPRDEPLPTPTQLPKSCRYLVRQLDERIRRADCLLVLAAMYVGHRGWIQSEIEAAMEFKKPIIAVRPRGQERVPEALRLVATGDPVGWNKGSVISAIRKCVLSRSTTLATLTGATTMMPPPGNVSSIADSIAGLGLRPPRMMPPPGRLSTLSSLANLGPEKPPITPPDRGISIGDLMRPLLPPKK
jgi:hypothetical protein